MPHQWQTVSDEMVVRVLLKNNLKIGVRFVYQLLRPLSPENDDWYNDSTFENVVLHDLELIGNILEILKERSPAELERQLSWQDEDRNTALFVAAMLDAKRKDDRRPLYDLFSKYDKRSDEKHPNSGFIPIYSYFVARGPGATTF